jgi:hypothetical protein
MEDEYVDETLQNVLRRAGYASIKARPPGDEPKDWDVLYEARPAC